MSLNDKVHVQDTASCIAIVLSFGRLQNISVSAQLYQDKNVKSVM